MLSSSRKVKVQVLLHAACSVVAVGACPGCSDLSNKDAVLWKFASVAPALPLLQSCVCPALPLLIWIFQLPSVVHGVNVL